MIQLKVQNYNRSQLILLDYALEKAQEAIMEAGCTQECTKCRLHKICRDLSHARTYISIQIENPHNTQM